VLPGIILICLLILPAAGASLVSDCWGDLFYAPQQECPLSLNNPYSSDTTFSLPYEGVTKAAQAESDDPSGSASLQTPSAIGRVSAWVNQNSMQGNANVVVSTTEYHQTVTATGQIHSFQFFASWVS